jgi:L-ribulose-5-phosphate 3-epimerase
MTYNEEKSPSNPVSFSLVVPDDEEKARVLLGRIAEAGFSGFEPTLSPSSSLPSVEYPEKGAETLRKMADSLGLKITGLRGGPAFWQDNAFGSSFLEKRLECVSLAKSAGAAARIMDVDTVLVVPGRWLGDHSYGEQWKYALESSQRIAEVAEDLGIRFGLENVENRFLLSPAEWRLFLDEVDSSSIRMYFDVGNVLYCRLGYPEWWLRELGRQYICRVHFKDSTENGQLVPLLEGDVNWPEVSKALTEISYDDWIGLELDIPSNKPEIFLRNCQQAAEQILGLKA